jgi:hypothetical protein
VFKLELGYDTGRRGTADSVGVKALMLFERDTSYFI